jgi:hypothetical protein
MPASIDVRLGGGNDFALQPNIARFKKAFRGSGSTESTGTKRRDVAGNRACYRNCTRSKFVFL